MKRHASSLPNWSTYGRRKRFSLMPAVSLAALGAIVAVPLLSTSHLHAASLPHYATVTVRNGDSLWKLAQANASSDTDVQETIDKIIAVNHLHGAAIAPGEHLRIPAP